MWVLSRVFLRDLANFYFFFALIKSWKDWVSWVYFTFLWCLYVFVGFILKYLQNTGSRSQKADFFFFENQTNHVGIKLGNRSYIYRIKRLCKDKLKHSALTTFSWFPSRSYFWPVFQLVIQKRGYLDSFVVLWSMFC